MDIENANSQGYFIPCDCVRGTEGKRRVLGGVPVAQTVQGYSRDNDDASYDSSSEADWYANYFCCSVILLSEDTLYRLQNVSAPTKSRACEEVSRTLAGPSLRPARRA
jgi:hypothetical protein